MSKKEAQAAQAAEKISTTIQNVQNVKGLLSELTCEVLWKNSVRATEVDRRLNKAAASNREMEKISASDKASESQKDQACKLQTDLQEMVEAISAMRQIFNSLRSADAKEMAELVLEGQDLRKNFDLCADLILGNITIVIELVHSLAKKLMEAGGPADLRDNFLHLISHLI